MSKNITVYKENGNTVSVIQSGENKVTVSSAVIQTSGVGGGGGIVDDKSKKMQFTNLSWNSLGDNGWYIELSHNLNKYASVGVIDSVDNIVYLEIEYISINTVQIKSTSKFSGSALFN